LIHPPPRVADGPGRKPDREREGVCSPPEPVRFQVKDFRGRIYSKEFVAGRLVVDREEPVHERPLNTMKLREERDDGLPIQVAGQLAVAHEPGQGNRFRFLRFL
jgi:hypothetical protein